MKEVLSDCTFKRRKQSCQIQALTHFRIFLFVMLWHKVTNTGDVVPFQLEILVIPIVR